jgi:LAO/AO transport system kinase
MIHPENDPRYIGLSVNAGIEKPEAVNADSVKRFLKKGKRKILSADDYFNGILKGNITILSQAVTLVESNKPEHQKVAQEIIIK